MISRSDLARGDRPDWYRRYTSQDFGDYFGSLRSIWPGETYLTYDTLSIVYRDHEGNISVKRNACAHAGAPLLVTPGEHSVERLQCPIHKWMYKPNGELIAAPHFKTCEGISLPSRQFGTWNGYILGYQQSELDSELASFGSELGLPAKCFDPQEFVYVDEEVRPMPYPGALMMINYLDGYHVPLYHQFTFDAVVDSSTYKWELSQRSERLQYSIQQVHARKDVKKYSDRLLAAHGTPPDKLGWTELHTWLRKSIPGLATPIDQDIFAAWAGIYGNSHLMLELYEGGLFLAVSSLVNAEPDDRDAGNLNVVEFYIHPNIPEELRDEAKRKFLTAYNQSADEDDDICKKLWEAHRLGNMKGMRRVYHEVLEKGDAHWRKWYAEFFADEK